MRNRFCSQTEKKFWRVYWVEDGKEDMKDFDKKENADKLVTDLVYDAEDVTLVEVYEIRGKLVTRIEESSS